MSGLRDGGREEGPTFGIGFPFHRALCLTTAHSVNACARVLRGLRARGDRRRRIASKCPFGMHCISIKASAPTRARTSGVNGRRQVRGHCLFI